MVPTKGLAVGRADSGPPSDPPTRRRGAQLEAALLDAAWAELAAVGYGAFTMEGVAARAKTSRAVLYRRWPNRPDLAIAAIRRQAKLGADGIPDTGTLRGDVLALLRHVSARAGELAGVISFLVAGYFDETGTSAAAVRERELTGEPTAMEIVLDRAAARGEIDPGRLSPRIASLPLDLLRHDLIMNRAPASDDTLIEIIDRLFLPLVLADQPERAEGHDRGERDNHALRPGRGSR